MPTCINLQEQNQIYVQFHIAIPASGDCGTWSGAPASSSPPGAPRPGRFLRFGGLGLAKLANFAKFANFWRARSRLYQNEIVQENMRLTAFFKLYKIFTILRRSNLNILQNFVKNLMILRKNIETFEHFQKN